MVSVIDKERKILGAISRNDFEEAYSLINSYPEIVSRYHDIEENIFLYRMYTILRSWVTLNDSLIKYIVHFNSKKEDFENMLKQYEEKNDAMIKNAMEELLSTLKRLQYFMNRLEEISRTLSRKYADNTYYSEISGTVNDSLGKYITYGAKIRDAAKDIKELLNIGTTRYDMEKAAGYLNTIYYDLKNYTNFTPGNIKAPIASASEKIKSSLTELSELSRKYDMYEFLFNSEAGLPVEVIQKHGILPEKEEYSVSTSDYVYLGRGVPVDMLPPGDMLTQGETSGEKIKEIMEYSEKIISEEFTIHEKKIMKDYIIFYCNAKNDSEFYDSFENIRKKLHEKNLFPYHKYQNGEHLFIIVHGSTGKKKSIKVNVILLVLTIITTVITGSMLWIGSMGNGADNIFDIFDLNALLNGALYFSLPLMIILGGHELGHYFVARRYGLYSTLPYFIPVPPFIGFIGTFGAFISMKDPIPSRRALFDIGAAGPVAGFIISIPVIIIGLLLSREASTVVNNGQSVFIIGFPLLFDIFLMFIHIPNDVYIHPTAFAGWVGLLVTSINLLPIGQLDGGHIARAIFGDKIKIFSNITMIFLIIMGMLYSGWLVFAFLILILGMNHPPPLNDISRLGPKRKIFSFVLLAIIILSFIPVPVQEATAPMDIHSSEVTIDGDIYTYNQSLKLVIKLQNNGNFKDIFRINMMAKDTSGWNISSPDMYNAASTVSGNSTFISYAEYNLTEGENATLNLSVIPLNVTSGKVLHLNVSSYIMKNGKWMISSTAYHNITVSSFSAKTNSTCEFTVSKEAILYEHKNCYNVTFVMENLINATNNINISFSSEPDNSIFNYTLTVSDYNMSGNAENTSSDKHIVYTSPDNMNFAMHPYGNYLFHLCINVTGVIDREYIVHVRMISIYDDSIITGEIIFMHS